MTVVACAEAAGVSRVTLHRIEAGNPSVTIGAYSNVAAALGLHLVVPVLDKPAVEQTTITVGDYAGLRALAWQTEAGTTITETEALNLYERGWRHLDQGTLTDREKALIQHLADTYSNGALLVQAAAPPAGGRGALAARRSTPGRAQLLVRRWYGDRARQRRVPRIGRHRIPGLRPAVLPRVAADRQRAWARRTGPARTGSPPAALGRRIRDQGLCAHGGVPIKFGIIHEARIDLDVPSPEEEICGVRILTTTDQVASKLLANDDRWADTSTFSRDLIDLAMMKPDTAAVEAGAHKAVEAYGKTVGESLDNAVAYLRERPHRLDQYIRALSIDAPRAVVWQSIRELAARCAKVEGLGSTTSSTASGTS